MFREHRQSCPEHMFGKDNLKMKGQYLSVNAKKIILVDNCNGRKNKHSNNYSKNRSRMSENKNGFFEGHNKGDMNSNHKTRCDCCGVKIKTKDVCDSSENSQVCDENAVKNGKQPDSYERYKKLIDYICAKNAQQQNEAGEKYCEDKHIKRRKLNNGLFYNKTNGPKRSQIDKLHHCLDCYMEAVCKLETSAETSAIIPYNKHCHCSNRNVLSKNIGVANECDWNESYANFNRPCIDKTYFDVVPLNRKKTKVLKIDVQSQTDSVPCSGCFCTSENVRVNINHSPTDYTPCNPFLYDLDESSKDECKTETSGENTSLDNGECCCICLEPHEPEKEETDPCSDDVDPCSYAYDKQQSALEETTNVVIKPITPFIDDRPNANERENKYHNILEYTCTDDKRRLELLCFEVPKPTPPNEEKNVKGNEVVCCKCNSEKHRLFQKSSPIDECTSRMISLIDYCDFGEVEKSLNKISKKDNIEETKAKNDRTNRKTLKNCQCSSNRNGDDDDGGDDKRKSCISSFYDPPKHQCDKHMRYTFNDTAPLNSQNRTSVDDKVKDSSKPVPCSLCTFDCVKKDDLPKDSDQKNDGKLNCDFRLCSQNVQKELNQYINDKKMSTKKGELQRLRPQKYQNRFAFKNNLHDTSKRTKQINNIKITKVCERCTAILEWKIKYKKYKLLKNPSTCVKCHNKCVKEPYHTMCEPCSTKLKVCPKCGKDKETVTQGGNTNCESAAIASDQADQEYDEDEDDSGEDDESD